MSNIDLLTDAKEKGYDCILIVTDGKNVVICQTTKIEKVGSDKIVFEHYQDTDIDLIDFVVLNDTGQYIIQMRHPYWTYV